MAGPLKEQGHPLEAVILAGGKGTRLAGVVPHLPKPLAPVHGRPFLRYLLQSLPAGGVERAILSIGHMADSIRREFEQDASALDIRFCEESSPLGTGGAIRAALRLAEGNPVFAVNGDTFATVDYAAMWREHLQSGRALTLALMRVEDTARYGAVQVRASRVTGFSEKGRSGPGYINAGVYLMRRDLLESLHLPEAFSFEEVMTRRLDELQPGAFFAEGYFIDIGVPEDYERAQAELPGQVAMTG